MNGIERRKLEHLDLCIEKDVEARATNLLEEVHLLHEAIPELAWDQVDPSLTLLGRRLQLPLLVSGMTGGAERAREINLALAEMAQKLGLGMGLGSQRAMLHDPDAAASYRVREVAPDILLLANLSVVQAREVGVARVAALVEAVGADAICIHFNVAQELVQDEGDRDFRGALETLAELVEGLAVPVIAKETGCGFGPRTLARLAATRVAAVDVSGRGGTSWTAVESERGSERQRLLGSALREWGVPTAAAIVYARRAGLPVIASGGIRTPLDIIRSLTLGADAVSLALPFLRAFAEGGRGALLSHAERLAEGLQSLMLLVGARELKELPEIPRVVGPSLKAWLGPLNHASGGGDDGRE